MYDGVPSIRLEGDQQRALALIPEAKALLYQCQDLIKNAGVSTFSMSKSVEDGYIYVLCANGQNIISISVGVEAVDETYEEQEYPYSVPPDFYSGIVASMAMRYVEVAKGDGSTVDVPVCPSFSPTPDCIESHPNDKLVQGRQQVSRLGVEPHTILSELKNENSDSSDVYHQYGKLRSSMYSGTMRKAAQLVMGLGRMPAAKFRDPFDPPDKPDSAYVKSVVGPGVQMRYDYKFHRTHGIVYADDGKPWLVEISMSRGVLAMPLPVFARASRDGFKENARDRKDDAMVYALDELGYLPTGECFSFSDAEIEKNVKAGTNLRLATAADVGAFYDTFLPYSSACGWAFSPDGREAHNTGWKIAADNIQTGAWFQINISIGALRPRRLAGEPIAFGSATVRKIREGRIYCNPRGPAPRLRHHFVPFKIYEPLFEGLISHEGVPAGPIAGDPPISDTPVFVCFVGNSLKVVSYYHNPEYLTREATTMEEEYGSCLLAGEWELTQGERTLLPQMMYTNDFDYRREIQINYSKETLESVDLGYKPGFASFFVGRSDHWATGLRYKGFSNKHTITRDITERVTGYVIVPRFSREAFYFATSDWEGKYVDETDPDADPGSDPIDTAHRDWQFNIRDPHIYSMFVCGTYGETSFDLMPDYITDSVPDRLRCRGGASCPFVAAGDDFNPPNPRMINHYYRPNVACAEEYADEGPWLDSCQQLPQASDVPGPVRWPTYDRQSFTTYPYRQDSALFFVSQGHNGPIQIDTSVARVQTWWGRVSPDNNGIYQQIAATHSAIGEECVVYDTAPHDDPGRTQVATGYLPDSIPPLIYPTFVGVNIA